MASFAKLKSNKTRGKRQMIRVASAKDSQLYLCGERKKKTDHILTVGANITRKKTNMRENLYMNKTNHILTVGAAAEMAAW